VFLVNSRPHVFSATHSVEQYCISQSYPAFLQSSLYSILRLTLYFSYYLPVADVDTGYSFYRAFSSQFLLRDRLINWWNYQANYFLGFRSIDFSSILTLLISALSLLFYFYIICHRTLYYQ